MIVLALINGELQEVEITQGGGGTSVPLFVASDETFAVTENTQVLFSEMIDIDGILDLDGILVEVN